MKSIYEIVADVTDLKPLLLLIKAAEAEDWAYVDAQIGNATTESNLKWAGSSGLKDPNQHVRDLAASLFEKSDASIPEGPRIEMYEMIRTDSNIFVRYRLAFALWKHGDHSEIIYQTLMEASKNADVAAIATAYLNQV